MAAVGFDVLEYMQQLEAAGMPRGQAEVVAKGASAVFVHNLDALVTKDYLDARFNEFESRIALMIDRRITEFQAQYESKLEDLQIRLDGKLAEMEVRFDDKLTQMEARFDGKLVEMEARFDGKLVKMETRLDSKLENMETQLNGNIDKMQFQLAEKWGKSQSRQDGKFDHLQGQIAALQATKKLHTWILSVLVVTTLIPALSTLKVI